MLLWRSFAIVESQIILALIDWCVSLLFYTPICLKSILIGYYSHLIKLIFCTFLRNGYTSVYKGMMSLSCGKLGEMLKTGEFFMTFSEIPNMSEYNTDWAAKFPTARKGFLFFIACSCLLPSYTTSLVIFGIMWALFGSSNGYTWLKFLYGRMQVDLESSKKLF